MPVWWCFRGVCRQRRRCVSRSSCTTQGRRCHTVAASLTIGIPGPVVSTRLSNRNLQLGSRSPRLTFATRDTAIARWYFWLYCSETLDAELEFEEIFSSIEWNSEKTTRLQRVANNAKHIPYCTKGQESSEVAACLYSQFHAVLPCLTDWWPMVTCH